MACNTIFVPKGPVRAQLTMLIELHRKQLEGKQTDLILLDFSKAFGKVSHKKLIHKLYGYGVRGKTLSWIKSVLSGRSQTVVSEGDQSEEVPVTSGVPQGSVLGPILFLVYINDLPKKVKSSVRLFADDTAAYLAITKLADGQQLQEDLNVLQQWEADWNMEFNPGKCQVLQITRSRSPIQTSYTMHGHTLEIVSCAKYLGMDISNDLSWKAHISRITGNANQALGFLRRNLKATNPAIREKAYKAIVRPSWSMLLQSGILTSKMTFRKLRWFRGGRLGESLGIIRPIQACQTCWRSLAGEPSSSGALMHDWSYFIRLYMAMSLSLSLVMSSLFHVSQELRIHWLIDRSPHEQITPFTP